MKRKMLEVPLADVYETPTSNTSSSTKVPSERRLTGSGKKKRRFSKTLATSNTGSGKKKDGFSIAKYNDTRVIKKHEDGTFHCEGQLEERFPAESYIDIQADRRKNRKVKEAEAEAKEKERARAKAKAQKAENDEMQRRIAAEARQEAAATIENRKAANVTNVIIWPKRTSKYKLFSSYSICLLVYLVFIDALHRNKNRCSESQ
jgi:hypothetical protein